MRIVVINHSHPSTPHVSALRAWHFAKELSARGHQVVLLCQGREDVPFGPEGPALGGVIAGHDWRLPLVVAVRPGPAGLLARVRAGETWPPLRKAMVAWSFVRHSGVFTDFRRGAELVLLPLADHFRPDVIWSLFGNTECWMIAQRLGAASDCRWVADMKDAWDSWIPRGLRRVLARRFQDMAGATANARFHADGFQRWFPGEAAVVYSGVDQDWLQPVAEPPDTFSVTMMGGVYDEANLAGFVRGLALWIQTLRRQDRERVRFCYAGSDHARVHAATAVLRGAVRVDVQGQLTLPELARLCRSAAVNVYISSPGTFHHKFIELLCSRRPIISFPGEHAESEALARQVGGHLTICRSAVEVPQVLQAIWAGSRASVGGIEALGALTWAAQVQGLERVLMRAARIQ